MEESQKTLHVLVDSRETSVSFARKYFIYAGVDVLGIVEHIRGITFADRFEALINRCSAQDEILVAVHYLSEEQLERATSSLRKTSHDKSKITFATYSCFTHVREWCTATDCGFLDNLYKKRAKPNATTGRKNASFESEQLQRIWVQYRLMLAIISRVDSLGDVCRQLISGMPVEGDTLENEYVRALRYFEQGEPDMAGGSYSCEESQRMNTIDELRFRVNKIAATDFNVLIKGESGSGKEAIAWAIHELSSRRDKPFIAINCAGLPDELLESEMFGYRKGSHNQAYEDSVGILDSANGGTLFLDELPEMSPRIQAKLLRFMESGEYRPLGGVGNQYSDTRVIAAGQPIRLDATDGVRPDLKSRIGQLDVDLLPLREVERNSPGTLYKIAFVLLERYTWTTIFHENRLRELLPCDIKEFQDALAEEHKLELLSAQDWKESNVRELNTFLRKWIVFGGDEFKLLEKRTTSTLLPGDCIGKSMFYDEQLEDFLYKPSNRQELKELFSKKPLQHMKKSYIRHLYEIYSKIVVQENEGLDMPNKPTQKELAKLMGVTENTISRHLN